MAQLPSIPKGTRDYSPEIMVKRNYIFDTIKSVFKLYGYMPLETPAMENLSTLMGKYGEEGDKLLFKILNSGDFIGNIPDQELVEKNTYPIYSLLRWIVSEEVAKIAVPLFFFISGFLFF